MTVLGTRTQQTFNIIGGTVYDLSPDFLFLEDYNLNCIETLGDGTTRTLVLGTDFTVTGGNGNSGSVITTEVLTGDTLLVYRDVEAIQQYDARVGDGFNTDTFERQLDRMVMAIQEAESSIGNAITLPIETPDDVSGILPLPAPFNFIRWNEDGTKFENTSGLGDTDFLIHVETKTLIDSQTVVDFVNKARGASFTIKGDQVDTGVLIKEDDFTFINDNSIQLNHSYPAGTKLIMAYSVEASIQDVEEGIYVLKTGDVMTGPLVMSSNRITQVAEGVLPDDVATVSQLGSGGGDDYLPIDGTAVNSEKLEGHPASYFATSDHDHDSEYLAIDGTAADSDKLGGTPATDFYHKVDFIDESTGAADAGKPIVLDANGVVSQSMISVSPLYYVGSFTPTAEQEYPDTSGETAGAFWSVILDTPYTFTGGDLAGEEIEGGDFMVWGTAGWSISKSKIDITAYYLLDGSSPLAGDMHAAGYHIKELGEGVDAGDAINKGQADRDYMYANITQLSDTTDLNTITRAGSYLTHPSNPNLPPNVTVDGTLLVAGSSSTCSQTFISSDDETFTRYYKSSAWTSWVMIADASKFLPLSGGTMTDEIDMGGNNIVNVPDGINPNDAVNKSQLDSVGGDYLPITGGTMNGDIDMSGFKITNLPEGVDPSDPATVSQLGDGGGGDYVERTGDTMTGTLTMSEADIAFEYYSRADITFTANGSPAASIASSEDNNFLEFRKYGPTPVVFSLVSDAELGQGSHIKSTAPLLIHATYPLIYLKSEAGGDFQYIRGLTNDEEYTWLVGNIGPSSEAVFRSYTTNETVLSELTLDNGNVRINGASPIATNHLTRKDYVDGRVNTKLSLSGGTMTGDLNMGSNTILNLPDAGSTHEPATLGQLIDYTDDLLGKTETAADSDKLGGIGAADYARVNVGNIFTTHQTMQTNMGLQFSSSNHKLYSNGSNLVIYASSGSVVFTVGGGTAAILGSDHVFKAYGGFDAYNQKLTSLASGTESSDGVNVSQLSALQSEVYQLRAEVAQLRADIANL